MECTEQLQNAKCTPYSTYDAGGGAGTSSWKYPKLCEE